jgi:DNA-directed RNA polymerase subunit RPC12/RpoP
VSEQLADALTVANAKELLASIPCPYCGSRGTLGLFHEPNNNGTGIVCRSCGQRHPLRAQRVMWLRQDGEKKPKRANDIAAVIKECGAYCYVCGTDFEILRQRQIGRHVHHTRPFAEHGDAVQKIPMCALCHEVASALQRQVGKLLAKGDPAP